MRYLTIIAVIFLLFAATPVYACLGPSEEYTLFFEKMPVPLPKADVIAKVLIEKIDASGGGKKGYPISAKVIEPLQGDLKRGDIVRFRYLETDCGPYQRSGEQGIIIATRSDEKGKIFLHPYSRRIGDGMIEAPQNYLQPSP